VQHMRTNIGYQRSANSIKFLSASKNSSGIWAVAMAIVPEVKVYRPGARTLCQVGFVGACYTISPSNFKSITTLICIIIWILCLRRSAELFRSRSGCSVSNDVVKHINGRPKFVVGFSYYLLISTLITY
jgi:hypothetical protein